MSFSQKDDLRLRMVDLEKKLAESEEERCKLEKTCAALIKSFREEERMRCIALNKKYEQFLQDFSVRKRRNDFILRSLCRIEDRSRALFAKTERLKLLKDRYISYLKLNDVKKGEVSSQLLETFPPSTSAHKITDDVTSKSVHWKIPLTTDQKKEKLREIGDVFWCNGTSGMFSGALMSDTISTDPENCKQGRSDEIHRYEDSKNSAGIVLYETFQIEGPATSTITQNKLKVERIRSDFCESLAGSHFIHHKGEKLFRDNDQRKPENDCASKDETSNGKFEVKNLSGISGSVMNHQKSVEKLQKAHSLGEEYSKNKNDDKKLYSNDGEIIGKTDTESSEKEPIKNRNNLKNELQSSINYRVLPFRFNNDTRDEEKDENPVDHTDFQEKVPNDFLPNDMKSLPMGMDGVDYQNETYPESYYEQPVYHHNRTNIAADVILEEDETEENVEEEEEDLTDDHSFIKTRVFSEDSHESIAWMQSPERRILNENLENTTSKVHVLDANNCEESNDQTKTEKYDSEKSSEAKQSDLGLGEPKRNRSGSLVSDKSDRSRTPIRSNLIHLLESDSESFQIEHGDGVAENEDSDFDLSFH